MRELMAQLGFRKLTDLIGHTERLETREAVDHYKAQGLDFSNIFYQPPVSGAVGRYCQIAQDHGLDKSLDVTKLLPLCQPALDNGTPVTATLPIRNVNRTVGTTLGYEITLRHGAAGLPDDTIRVHFTGSAGQSFGAFVPRGIAFTLEGDANDYFGKGLSGGRLVVHPHRRATFVPEDNIVIGTDYGHNDQSTEVEAIRTLRDSGGITREQYEKVTYHNPRALYGL